MTFAFVLGMLPKPVADDLRQGRTAEAQSYSNATVYFRQESNTKSETRLSIHDFLV